MFNLITDVGDVFDRHLQSIIPKSGSKSLEVKSLSVQFTAEIIASCAFGINGYCIENEKSEFVLAGAEMFNFTPYRGFEFATSFFMPSFGKLFRVRVSKEYI